MGLLQIIQDAADTIGIPRPTAVISSPDLQVRRLLAAAQREGLSLQRRFYWQATAREATWTTTATEDQGLLETLAPAYDGFIDETQWNRTQQQRLFGPLSPQQWQARKASVNIGPSHFLYLRNKHLYVNPVPPAGETWAFEYWSKYFCQSNGGTDQSRWAADNDIGILDEELMTKGVIWRFKQSNGLDYAEDFNAYEADVALLMSRDGGAHRIDMGDPAPDWAGEPSVPEGNWDL